MWNKLKYKFGLDYTHFYKLNHDKDETIPFYVLIFMQQQKQQYTTKKSKSIVIFFYSVGVHVQEHTVYFILCLDRRTQTCTL